MKTIYTPKEAAHYIARLTGDLDLTERDVFERIKEIGLSEDCLSVVIPAGTALQHQTGCDVDKWTTYALPTPRELFIGIQFAVDFVEQLSLTGFGLPGQLSNALLPPHNQRFSTSTPIPTADVRLPKRLVISLLSQYHRLILNVENGDINLDRMMRDHEDTAADTKSEAATQKTVDTSTNHDKTEPQPVNTRAMADSFAGLHWTGDDWVNKLGSNLVWVKNCLVTGCGQGEGMRQWNPVLIGAYLVNMSHKKTNSVRARFQTEDALIPWLDEWKTYEANNWPES